MALKTRSDDLELLLAVIEFGGFSAAAEALNIQVARISRSVAKIEKALGTTILIRTTRRVMLTEEGKLFVKGVTEGLNSIQQAEAELPSNKLIPKGVLRIDAASPFIFHQLMPHMKAFNDVYPSIKLELNSNEGVIDLIEKRTDIAIRIGRLVDSTLHAKTLGRSALHIVAAPEYLAKNGIPSTPKDLEHHQSIGFSNIKTLNKWPLKGLESVSPSITASNGETIRQLALTGNGIACLSGFMVNQDINNGSLVSLLDNYRIEGTDREVISAVFYKSSAVSERVSAFIDFIKPRLKL